MLYKSLETNSPQYAAVPQADIEHEAPTHTHSSAQEQPQQTLVQTIASVLRPKPHAHCEECDMQTERRERRESERHCCTMVALVFMVLFICGMVLGITIAKMATRRTTMHHG